MRQNSPEETRQQIAILRSQAATQLARAAKKRKQAKTAHEPKAHTRLSAPGKPVPAFDPTSRPYLEKCATTKERIAAAMERRAAALDAMLI